MTKKLISTMLVALMVLSLCTMSFGTVSADIGELPQVAEGCNRYFFYLPKIWENELSQTAGIYWWENTGAMDEWPGVEAHKADAEGLFYYDVPKDVWTVIWNNMVTYDVRQDGWQDSLEYKLARQTININVEYYEPGESPLYPDGLESFNNMVWVVDYENCNCMEWDVKGMNGDWYYYYGNGEYGTTPEPSDVVYTDRSIGEYCSHQKPETDDFGLPQVAEGCNRYYFLAPDDWFNEYSDTVGIYWWEGTGAASSWPGYEAHKADAEGVYYYDVPEDVTDIIWNNYISLFLEEYDEGQWANKQTGHKEWDENKVPLSECDGKIYVINPAKTETNPFSGKMTYFGDWFYYYGNGEYGITLEKETPAENILGDADFNSLLTISDATAIQKYTAGIVSETFSVTLADVNGDKDINIKDATEVQKHLAWISVDYPIGDKV